MPASFPIEDIIASIGGFLRKELRSAVTISVEDTEKRPPRSVDLEQNPAAVCNSANNHGAKG